MCSHTPLYAPAQQKGAYRTVTYVLFGNNAAKPPFFVTPNFTGIQGYEIDGIYTADSYGQTLAVGDINGDGIGDIIIGSMFTSPGGNYHAGSAYVVFGSKTPPASPIQLSALNGTNGFELDGATQSDLLGSAVATGDVNGDGRADVILGAEEASYGTFYGGSTYVLFGQKQTTWTTPNNLSGINGR